MLLVTVTKHVSIALKSARYKNIAKLERRAKFLALLAKKAQKKLTQIVTATEFRRKQGCTLATAYNRGTLSVKC